MEPIYPITVCPHRFVLEHQGHSIAMPCCWSQAIGQFDDRIERLIIFIHGVRRNADEYYPNMLAALEHAGTTQNSLLIAPQFLTVDDLSRFDLSADVPYWGGKTGEGWKRGDDSISTEAYPRNVTVSAYEVVDRMIERAANLEAFPNLKSIVVAGHSAGGQYVCRYAAGTLIDQSIPETIRLRFIVANPSTYLYLNNERRVADTNDFAVPDGAPADYDDYKFGLQKLNPYMAAVGADQIRPRFPHKEVVYLLGGEDTGEAMLDQSPNANLQGKNRLERGQVYYRYLKHLYGEEITRTHKIAIIPCVGHDGAAMFRSEAGIKSLCQDSAFG